MAKDSIDPITLAVVKGALEQIVEEMDAIIVRAAFSPVISEQLDRSSGIFHPESGEVVAQGTLSPPLFVTAMQVTTQATLEAARQRGGFRPGDVYIVNNPYLAGTHLPDIKLVAPVFVEGRLIALLATCGHWNDIGGATPGGFAPTATEIHQEGLLLNPRPLYREGVLQEDFLGFLLDNVRMAEERRGDLNACIAALDVGKARMGELVERHGAATVLDTFQSLNDRSEQHMRSLIREIPDGTYSFRHKLDNDGQQDRELVIQLSATVRGDTIRFDFSGSSPPVRGAVNVPRKTCIAACQIAIKHLFPEVPINGGCFRPFEYEIPATTFLGVEYPYAISGYLESIGRVVSTVVGALNPGLPQRALADSISTTGVITMSGTHPQRNAYYVMLFPAAGGYGAHAHGDGVNVLSWPSNISSTPVEIIEQVAPLKVHHRRFRAVDEANGQYRGGTGQEMLLESLSANPATISFMAERTRPESAAPGLAGGAPGAPGEILIDGVKVNPKAQQIVKRGAKVLLRTPGGGGYGDANARAPERIEQDRLRGHTR
jgi:N-methylhydantoinase B